MSSALRHSMKAIPAIAIAMTVAVLPARAQAPEALVEAAKAEGSATVYTNIDPGIMQSLSEAFEEKYGVRIEVQRQGSSALAQRFMAEDQSGNSLADVYYSTDRGFHEDRAADGKFAALDEVPGLAEWPEKAKQKGMVTVGYNPYSIVWNKTLFPEGLKSWEDLVNPKLAGKIMLTDPRSGVTSNQFYKMLRDLYGDEFLQKLGKMATYSQSAVPGIQQVAGGAQTVYAPGIHQVIVGLVKNGAPLDESFPSPTISSDNMISLVAKAPHPNAGKLFISFLLTPEAQSLNNPDGFSPIEGVPNTRKMPDVRVIDPRAAKAESDAMYRLMGL
ncbi:ABC transporter substrate-binding protein [Rhizobium sp. SSA_523]|uniref:ABC transporter substrate-binding protein n=1 Tax=Rhizobium sp. SSA_523 TaxID=2952477 RepID=UPI002090F11D|nr:extracellular solute-binding protein [Rhizobium sp. SSA_523]MCO5731589.1 extracellular solute-binding protein [Rhizobium sp. SSA_523]WKC21897.1 extracellular solute-binding protein [Rhizobium sp. SSA_523]